MPDIRYFEAMTPEPEQMATVNGQLVTKTVDGQTTIFRVRDATFGREYAFAVPKEMVDNMPIGETLFYATESLARRMPDHMRSPAWSPRQSAEQSLARRYGLRMPSGERASRWDERQARRPSDSRHVDGYNPEVAAVAHRNYNRLGHLDWSPSPKKFDPAEEKAEKKKSVIRMIRFRVG